MPNVVILAGPNGAGKTSSAPIILRDRLKVTEFVNADVIARGLAGFAVGTAAVEAGRVMLRRLDDLALARADFAFEATLSGTTFLRSIDRWREAGYVIHIVYLWLDSPDIAIERVQRRVREGGHAVPDDVIRRRYERSLFNFVNRYRALADDWYVYDNTCAGNPRVREVLVTDRLPLPDDDVARRFADVAGMNHAMSVAFARVVRRHRLLNQPLVFGENGKVVCLDPHTVPMPEGVTEEEMGPVFDYL